MIKLALLLAFLPLILIAEDWPEFRGPTGQGISQERGLPLTWSETENVRWKEPVPGRGWSSPVIQGDLLWLTTATEDGRSLRALCFNRVTGKLIRDVELFKLADKGPLNDKNSQASPTPILDGDRVYVHFGAHGTACLSRSGEVIWTMKELKYTPQHGPGGSPALFEDLLIISCDGDDRQFVVALDKNTGKIRWKKPRAGHQAYTTPLIIRIGGQEQVVSPGAFRAVSYDPRNGREIWSVRYGQGFSNVPRPVFGHGLVFICTGFFQPDLLAVRPDGEGDVTDNHLAWKLSRGVPLTPSPLLVGDEIYTVSDNGIATCLDARTGKTWWRERIGSAFSASPVLADGRIYFLSEDGDTVAIEPGKEFRKLATNHLEGHTLASMAVSGGSFFIRSQTHLYRVEPVAKTRTALALRR